MLPRPHKTHSGMSEESPIHGSTDAGAVFLSYASQDGQAARLICEALRAAGIEVWLDQSELRGGDAWDQSIRRQIKNCALFMPLISKHTHERAEGYFRLEWKLAVDRSHFITAHKAFLLPVVIDATGDDEEHVPDKFREVQWTRLPAGETPPEFVKRVKQLLSAGLPQPAGATIARPAPVSARRSRLNPGWLAVVGLAALAAFGAYLFIAKPWVGKPAPQVFAPPPHSIAVLPFVNMSGDKDQEYFSDGLTEELLNSLAQINELQVAARTSAFSFKGTNTDIGVIGRKLNVGAVLEGSVRRSGNTVRVTTQLINAVTGYHLWSHTFDRDLGDALKLESDIADAVASALKVSLLGNVANKIELGGTRNAAAFDAYLRGTAQGRIALSASPADCTAPLETLNTAIALDANYALAYANRAALRWSCAENSRDWLEMQPIEVQVRADAERAIVLAPGLAEGYLALSAIEEGVQQFSAADQSCARARELAPGSARVLESCGQMAANFGRFDSAIADGQHAVALDPLNPLVRRALGATLRSARRYEESAKAYQAAIAAAPEHSDDLHGQRGIVLFLAGNLTQAKSACEVKPDNYRSLICRAIVYDRLGRKADAAKAFARTMQVAGDASAYQYAEIQAQWGDHKAALDWLDKAVQIHDPGLVYTKVDPLLDPLRKEPRFQSIERELKFPSI